MFYVIIIVQYGDRDAQRIIQSEIKIEQEEIVRSILAAFSHENKDKKDVRELLQSLVKTILNNIDPSKAILSEFIRLLRLADIVVQVLYLQGDDIKLLPTQH